MAKFARIDKNNIVQSLRVIADEHLLNEHGQEEEDFGIAYLNKMHGYGLTWVQYKGQDVQKNAAGIGYTYDATKDAFIPPKPFASWTLDASTCQWVAPVAYPTEPERWEGGKYFIWNEDDGSWDVQEDPEGWAYGV